MNNFSKSPPFHLLVFILLTALFVVVIQIAVSLFFTPKPLTKEEQDFSIQVIIDGVNNQKTPKDISEQIPFLTEKQIQDIIHSDPKIILHNQVENNPVYSGYALIAQKQQYRFLPNSKTLFVSYWKTKESCEEQSKQYHISLCLPLAIPINPTKTKTP